MPAGAEGGTSFGRKERLTKNDKSRTRIDSPLPRRLNWQRGLPHVFCLFSKVNIGLGGDEKACFLAALRCRCDAHAGSQS